MRLCGAALLQTLLNFGLFVAGLQVAKKPGLPSDHQRLVDSGLQVAIKPGLPSDHQRLVDSGLQVAIKPGLPSDHQRLVDSGLQVAKKPRLPSDHLRRMYLQKEFGSSFKLSRQLLCKIQILTRQYLSERLPGVQLNFLSRSELLPSASLSVQKWLSLSNATRLSHMAKMLVFYQKLVQQLRAHEAQKEDSRFIHRFDDLSVYLRDLSRHVSHQISLWGLLSEDQPEPTHNPPQILQHESTWRNRQEVYHVLRSLENALCRIVRDFVILRVRVAGRSPHQGASNSSVSQHLPF